MRTFLIASLLCLILPSFSWANPSDRVALVYRGEGACEDGCAIAAANTAARAGFHIRFVDHNTPLKSTLKGAALWVQPGGNAIAAARALGVGRLQMIREFVAQGGGYVGFCAGAFLADKFVDDNRRNRVPGLGLIPFEAVEMPGDDSWPDGTIIPLIWMNQARWVFFNGGAVFDYNGEPNVEILARTLDEMPVTIHTRFGLGNVVLSGAHPEALDEWKNEPPVLNDPDGSDWDLAEDMMVRARPHGAR